MTERELERRLRRETTRRLDERISLGNTSMRLVSNLTGFKGASFFSQRARQAATSDAGEADYELWCIDDPGARRRASLGPVPPAGSYRAECFRIGYYATDHFGPPIVLHQFANRYYVVGEELERVVWPYFVKLFVFLKSLADGHLFLKGAAVAFGASGVLILGRGGAGKTTLVQRLCRQGAAFVTNSHAVLDGRKLIGVPGKMRVRPGGAEHPGQETDALRDGEMLVDPLESGTPAAGRVEVSALCIVDYREGRDDGVTPLDGEQASGFLEQFALGLNVYRLEEELLEFHDHDVARFSEAVAALKARLRRLVMSVPCHVVRTDMRDDANSKRVFERLGLPGATPP